jgi:hypothetical protein
LIYEYELTRPRKIKADLSRFRMGYDKWVLCFKNNHSDFIFAFNLHNSTFI